MEKAPTRRAMGRDAAERDESRHPAPAPRRRLPGAGSPAPARRNWSGLFSTDGSGLNLPKPSCAPAPHNVMDAEQLDALLAVAAAIERLDVPFLVPRCFRWNTFPGSPEGERK